MAQATTKRKSSKPSQFSIDIDAKGLTLLLVMVGLTMLTVFYLGVIFGKAQREPTPLNQVTEGEQATQTPPKDLKIYDLKKDSTGLESLKKDFDQLDQSTDQLQDKEKARLEQTRMIDAESAKVTSGGLEVEAEPKQQVKKPAATQPTAKSQKEFTPTWAEQVLSDTPPQPKGEQYSIQVIATVNQNGAQDLIKRLQNKGFDAYLEAVKLEDATIYRVRVGREDRETITRIKKRLQVYLKGYDSKFQIIQLR